MAIPSQIFYLWWFISSCDTGNIYHWNNTTAVASAVFKMVIAEIRCDDRFQSFLGGKKLSVKASNEWKTSPAAPAYSSKRFPSSDLRIEKVAGVNECLRENFGNYVKANNLTNSWHEPGPFTLLFSKSTLFDS